MVTSEFAIYTTTDELTIYWKLKTCFTPYIIFYTYFLRLHLCHTMCHLHLTNRVHFPKVEAPHENNKEAGALMLPNRICHVRNII